MAPRILTFSIAMGAEYSSYMKFIATEAPTFFGYIISVLASVNGVIGWKKYADVLMLQFGNSPEDDLGNKHVHCKPFHTN